MEHDILGKVAGTLRREGLAVALRKVGRRARYAWMRNRYPTVPEQSKWAELKGRYSGQRAFLLGNGPSLNKLPLHLLKGEFTLCFNRFNIMMERLNWRPNFYMTVDDLVLSDLVDEIPGMMDVADHFFFPDIHFRGRRYASSIDTHPKIWWLRPRLGRGFSTDMPHVHPGGSVIYEGMQVLRYLGFDTVYLLGVDMNFRIHETVKYLGGDATSIRSQDDDDPNHFDPRYFGKNRGYHQPEPHVIRYIMSSLEYAASVVPDLNFEVINAGVDSRVDYFPRADFRSLFDTSASEEAALINGLIKDRTRFSGLSQLDAAAESIDTLEQWDESAEVQSAPLDLGIDLIKRAVFTHLPLGPFGGRYFFVRRVLAS